jgi:hypothetical protein
VWDRSQSDRAAVCAPSWRAAPERHPGTHAGAARTEEAQRASALLQPDLGRIEWSVRHAAQNLDGDLLPRRDQQGVVRDIGHFPDDGPGDRVDIPLAAPLTILQIDQDARLGVGHGFRRAVGELHLEAAVDLRALTGTLVCQLQPAGGRGVGGGADADRPNPSVTATAAMMPRTRRMDPPTASSRGMNHALLGNAHTACLVLTQAAAHEDHAHDRPTSGAQGALAQDRGLLVGLEQSSPLSRSGDIMAPMVARRRRSEDPPWIPGGISGGCAGVLP